MHDFQILVLALLQGITELFPISSLGHAVLVPALLGWQIDQAAETFLPFLVVLHLGTATALLLFFGREWIGLIAALLGTGQPAERSERRHLVSLLVAGTIPAAAIGFLLEKSLRLLFAAPAIAAAFLLVNGTILFMGERLRRAGGMRQVKDLSWRQALLIGVWQSTALIPGISRSGVTMVGGLVAGLRHEDAARFSLLLATPIIGGAALLEVPKLLHQANRGELGLIVAAGVLAGVVAFASVALLMRYFKKREFDALIPFAYYSWAVGAISLVMLVVRT